MGREEPELVDVEIPDDAEEREAALLGQGVDRAVAESARLVSAPTIVRVNESPVLAALRYDGDGPSLSDLRHAMTRYPKNTVVRAGGIRNASNNFGFTVRNPVMQRYACRPCRPAVTHPELHEVISASGSVLSAMLARVLPDVVRHDDEVADAIRPEWRIPWSPWTSGVLNFNSPMPYHYDRNNLPTWSAMIVVRQGVRGGMLHVPTLGISVECRDGDVVYFPGWRFLHGVSPMVVGAAAYRFTAVFYTVDRMRHCLSPEEELQAGRVRRTAAEDTMLDRQRESGMLT